MSKEYLEALNYVWYNYYTEELSQNEVEEIEKNLNIVQDGLKRLEAIDNANPSEALECLELIGGANLLIYEETVADGFKEEIDIIKQALLKAQHPNSVNLLMQELDCKDFADLRKYARCGYDRLNNFKDSKEVKIEIPESGLMDYNPVKHYLKWENLEFDNNAQVKKYLKVKLGDNIYKAYYHFCFLLNSELFCIENDNENLNIYITNKQFFNDLHLERVEE